MNPSDEASRGTSVPRHQRPTRLKQFLFGTPYYPEHWTPDVRRDDPERMAAAGMNVVRMAEFAWDRMEPARGQFDFSLFDETIARLAKVGISTILCTPTATPPRWMTFGHDDWMRVDETGKRMDHGTRQHVCTNNEEFRAESQRVTRAMADHYAGHPSVIGWQTDNEFYCHFADCHCPSCQAGFRRWLRERYGTVARLNAAWGAAFWALTFDTFEQVPLPYPNCRPAFPNPTHELDYYRYLSDSLIEFQKQQVVILRELGPHWWITHNGMFGRIDYWKFTEDLDFLGKDIYPGFGPGEPLKSGPRVAYGHEQCRAASGGFIVPEQQGGPGGQKPYVHRTFPPGQMRLWAYQGIAHGADGVLHFRWRTCRFGAEEYWGGIIDHDNVPRRRYQEFAQEGRELQRIGDRILHTVLDVKAAVLVEREQDSAHDTMHLGLPSPDAQRRLAYHQLWAGHLPCGAVDTHDSFAGLELLVLPSMPLMDDELAGRLHDYVSAGGVLLVTARSAIRDRDNQVRGATLPGPLAKLCGLTIEEFSPEQPESGLMMELAGGGAIPFGVAYEILALHGAEALATWRAPESFGPCAAQGQPAICRHRVGRGQVIYVGTYLTETNAVAIMNLALAETRIAPLAEAAVEVEVTCRRSGARRLLFLLNHFPAAQTVRQLPAGQELLGQSRFAGGELTLPAYGVAIIEVA